MTLLALDIRLPVPAAGLDDRRLRTAIDANLARYFWLLLIPAGFAFRFFVPVKRAKA